VKITRLPIQVAHLPIAPPIVTATLGSIHYAEGVKAD